MGDDVFGLCCRDYLKFKDDNIAIIVESDIAETDLLSASHLFRNYDHMPFLEQKALNLARGNILDIGACAGSHSLYLQELGYNVISLDISPGCCEIMKDRGLKNVIEKDIFLFSDQTFDTILLLMNGIGIAGNLQNLPNLLEHLRSLLNPGGKIIFDSSDLQYLYLEDDGSINIPLTDKYYGELKYQLQYKNYKSDKFDWFFIDPYTIDAIAGECDFKMQFITEGEHYDYLACLY